MSERLDVIALRGLSALGVHGVLASEQVRPQLFRIDVSMWVNTAKAIGSDDVSDTVSYADVAHTAVRIVRGPSVRLIETLGARIAEAVLLDPRVEGVEVTVHKPEAPIGEPFSDVSVTITRGTVPTRPDSVKPEIVHVTQDVGGHLLQVSGSSAAEVAALASAILRRTSIDEDEANTVADGIPVGDFQGAVAPAVPEPAPMCEAVLALGGNIGDVPTTFTSVIEALINTEGVLLREVSPVLRTRPVLAPGQAAQADYWNAVVLLRTSLSPDELLARILDLEAAFGRQRREPWGARTVDIDLVQYEGVRRADARLTLPHPRAHQRAFVLAPWLLADPDAELQGRGKVGDLLQLTADRDGIVDAVEDWLEDPSSVIADSDAFLASEAADGSADNAALAPAGAPVQDTAPVTVSSCAPAATPEPAAGAVSAERPESAPVVPRITTRPVVHVPVPPMVVPALPVQTLSAKGAPTPKRTMLDLVPEASRQGLAPSQDAEDLVWRRLWQQWSKPMPDTVPGAAEQERDKPRSAKPPTTPLEQAKAQPEEAPVVRRSRAVVPPQHRPPTSAASSSGAAPAQVASSASTAQTSSWSFSLPTLPDTGAPAPASAGGAPAATSTAVPTVKAATPSPSRWTPVASEASEPAAPVPTRPSREAGPALANETPADPAAEPWDVPVAPPARRPRWKPVSEGASPSPWRAKASAPGAGAGREESLPQALPSWEFDSASPRIVDDEAGAPEGVLRRSVLDPGLPEGIARGPLQTGVEDAVHSTVMRKVTVRPTVTGQIPITRRGDEAK